MTKSKVSYIGFIKRNRLPLNELEKYYCNRRLEKYESGKSIRGIFLRKIMHTPIIKCLKLYHHICVRKLRIIYDKNKE